MYFFMKKERKKKRRDNRDRFIFYRYMVNWLNLTRKLEIAENLQLSTIRNIGIKHKFATI